MKSAICFFFLLLAIAASAQTSYYKGEWSRSTTSWNYAAFVKLTVSGSELQGEILWKVVSPDSLDREDLAYYANKLGLTAIEKIRGVYGMKTGDLDLVGTSEIDPDDVIGTDIYTLKFSKDKKIIFGKTDASGRGNGCFYAIKMETGSAEKEFNSLKASLLARQSKK
jgi:hypothetical protein